MAPRSVLTYHSPPRELERDRNSLGRIAETEPKQASRLSQRRRHRQAEESPPAGRSNESNGRPHRALPPLPRKRNYAHCWLLSMPFLIKNSTARLGPGTRERPLAIRAQTQPARCLQRPPCFH